MAGRKTRNTNEILVDILNELAEHTDSEHGLTVRELSDRVGATEKTVRAHLQLLAAQRPMGRTVRRLTAADIRQADSADARPGWCMEPAIDVAELRLFGDGLALSRIDEAYARESYDRLRALAGFAGTHSQGLRNIRVPRPYNREFLSNVENLDEAISGKRVVFFRMCDYAVDGSLSCIYDWFERPSVIRVDACTYEVAVHADPRTVLWWALQYSDNVDIDVVRPQSLRDAMAAVGRRLVERYGSGSGADNG